MLAVREVRRLVQDPGGIVDEGVERVPTGIGEGPRRRAGDVEARHPGVVAIQGESLRPAFVRDDLQRVVVDLAVVRVVWMMFVNCG